MRHETDRNPNELQAEIERTRSDLDETLSAIESRLAPGQLFEQGVEYLRHSGAREYVVNLGSAAKRDPLPLALVGIGLGWLMLSNGRGANRHDTAARTGPSAESIGSGARHAATSVRDTVSSTISSVRDTVASARDTAARTSERISETTQRIGESAQRMRSGIDRLVHEQPLALGAVGLAVGAVLAASAPRTRPEDRLMGEASSRLKDDAMQSGREQLDRAASALEPETGRPSGEAPGSDGVDPPRHAVVTTPSRELR